MAGNKTNHGNDVKRLDAACHKDRRKNKAAGLLDMAGKGAKTYCVLGPDLPKPDNLPAKPDNLQPKPDNLDEPADLFRPSWKAIGTTTKLPSL